MADDRPLVSRTTRNAVRRLMSNLFVGAIEEYWENEGFARNDSVTPRAGGVRQQTFDAYEASANWSDEAHVRRALRVFESLLRRLDRENRKLGADGLERSVLEELREAFHRDGYRLDGELRVHLRHLPQHEVPQVSTPVTPAGGVVGGRRITQVTRQRLFSRLTAEAVKWFGDLDEIDFLRRLYDLAALPSEDPRFPDAEGDIVQHRYNNYDWDDSWIYQDKRFGLSQGRDGELLTFLVEMLHPEVRYDDAEVVRLAGLIDEAVRRDGYTIEPIASVSGHPIYGARQLAGAESESADIQSHRRHAAAALFDGLQGPARADATSDMWAASTDAADAISERAAGEDTRAGELPAPPGEYSAVQAVARGVRKDYAMDRVRMKEGGQADIFAATHKATGIQVALKRRRSQRDTPAARMRREIDVAEDLNAHPHYMPILDANRAEGWLVMPMAQGTADDHRHLLQEPAELLALVDAMIEVLHTAHTHGWLHRDVKPSNILLLGGCWRLGDWGVVRRPRGQTTKADRTRTEVGTEGFAAPELSVAAHEASAAADIYGIGRVIAWALTGRNPELNEPLRPAPGPWRNIVRKATARDPLHRPQTVADLRDLIRQELADPGLPPRQEAERLLDAAVEGGPQAAETFISFIADHPEDGDLYIDTLTRLIPERAASALLALPNDAARLLEAMSNHASTRTRRIHYAEADKATLWLQRVSAFAAAESAWDLLDEAARAMCTWDSTWNQYRAQDHMVTWLRSLEGESALLLAAVLQEHPRCAEHLAGGLHQGGTDRQILNAVRQATSK
ncbi:protein kinase [Streptomyces vinaceus]|uniref:AbiJ-related protein n=1 Tax=Streptomyces vinaceus TaxID=1960 RepID=UPI0035DD1658